MSGANYLKAHPFLDENGRALALRFKNLFKLYTQITTLLY